MKQKIIIGIFSLVALTLLVAVVFDELTRKTNCGGNGYALSVCATFEATADFISQDNHSQFEIEKVGKNERQNLSLLARSGWGMSGANFLVRTNFILGGSSNRDIVIVCQRQFGNVPQPTIWNLYHQNLAYAVGYSDGNTGLISPDQFKNLNLTGFISLSNLVVNFEPFASKP